MTSIPDWRKGAIYHRAFRDGDDALTGREVTIYPTVDGGARMCEGLLACEFFDNEWTYRATGEAIHAAEAWDGTGHPPGNTFLSYRPAVEGNPIPTEENRQFADEERQALIDNLVRNQFPAVAKAMRNLAGAGAEDAIRAITLAIAVEQDAEAVLPEPYPVAPSPGLKKAVESAVTSATANSKFPLVGKGTHTITLEDGDEISQFKHNNMGDLRVVVKRKLPLMRQEGISAIGSDKIEMVDVEQIGWKFQRWHATLGNGMHDLTTGSRFRANLVEERDVLRPDNAVGAMKFDRQYGVANG